MRNKNENKNFSGPTHLLLAGSKKINNNLNLSLSVNYCLLDWGAPPFPSVISVASGSLSTDRVLRGKAKTRENQ
jgi:hypothetical protein